MYYDLCIMCYVLWYVLCYVRLPHEMGLARRVTLLLPPLVPSYPPPWMSFWVLSLRPILAQDCPKMGLETSSCPTSFSNGFGGRFWKIFDTNISPKSIKKSYLSQVWFQTRFLLPKPRIEVFLRRLKSFKTVGLLFKNRLCACQSLWQSIIFTWFEIGTKFHQISIKNCSQKHI